MKSAPNFENEVIKIIACGWPYALTRADVFKLSRHLGYSAKESDTDAFAPYIKVYDMQPSHVFDCKSGSVVPA